MAEPVAIPEFVWYDTKEFARLYGRHERTVRRWCGNGTITDFGFALSFHARGGGNNVGAWRIGVPVS